MMEISLDWYDSERTLLYLRLAGEWDTDESRRTIEAYKQKVGEVSHRVDLIIQALDKHTMNPPTWVLRLGVNGIMTTPKNAKLIVIVPNNTMLIALADAAIRLLGARYTGLIFTASTFDDAYQLIQILRKL
jgi:hypothetical protein